MTIALEVLATLLSCLALGRPVYIELNAREYYGGKCERRAIEVEIAGHWYETGPVRCP